MLKKGKKHSNDDNDINLIKQYLMNAHRQMITSIYFIYSVIYLFTMENQTRIVFYNDAKLVLLVTVHFKLITFITYL